MSIFYLKHDEISKIKWDRCISESFNGIVYAYSWYLDIVSYQWDALVMDDYKAVMPLTAKTGYALNKIILPDFAPQLGVFTSERLDIDLVNRFLDAIPQRFRSVKLGLNAYNKVSHPKFHIKHAERHQIDLILPYKANYLNFLPEAKTKIKLSKVQKVSVTNHINIKDLLLLRKSSSGEPLTFDQLNVLRRIIPFCTNHNIGSTLGSYNSKNELVAGAFFIQSHQKTICLLAACNEQGRGIGADFALFNHFITTQSEKNLTLDFGDYSPDEKNSIGFYFGGLAIQYHKLRRSRMSRLFNFFNDN